MEPIGGEFVPEGLRPEVGEGVQGVLDVLKAPELADIQEPKGRSTPTAALERHGDPLKRFLTARVALFRVHDKAPRHPQMAEERARVLAFSLEVHHYPLGAPGDLRDASPHHPRRESSLCRPPQGAQPAGAHPRDLAPLKVGTDECGSRFHFGQLWHGR